MSFNRLTYDICEEKKSLDQSVSPGLYQVNTPVLCSSCYQDNPQIRLQKNGNSLNNNVDWRFFAGPIDIDSELKNINKPYSKCPKNKYEPDCNGECTCNNQGQPCGQGAIDGCKIHGKNINNGKRCNDINNLTDFKTCHFPVEDTRLSNPSSNLRGTGWNRFQPLCLDPQKNILFSGEIGIPSRLVFKDNHRPCVPIPSINNMLPKSSNLPCIPIESTCGAYTGSLYQYDNCG